MRRKQRNRPDRSRRIEPPSTPTKTCFFVVARGGSPRQRGSAMIRSIPVPPSNLDAWGHPCWSARDARQRVTVHPVPSIELEERDTSARALERLALRLELLRVEHFVSGAAHQHELH